MSQLGDRPLQESDLDPDPLALLRRWFEDAEAHDVSEPNAAALASATPDGRPSLRMVLTISTRAGSSPLLSRRCAPSRPAGQATISPGSSSRVVPS